MELRFKPDLFLTFTAQPNELAAAGLAGISLNTLKRWLTDPASVTQVHLDTLYAILHEVGGMSNEDILSLKLGDIMAIVGQGD